MNEKFPGHAYAGITGVTRQGFGVEENAKILHRFAYIERQLLHVMAGRLIGTPEWEVKILFGRHLYEDAEHHQLLRARIAELRRSERSVDKRPDPALEALMNELIRAEDTIELLSGIYGVIKPALQTAYRQHTGSINPLVDYNTGRVMRMVMMEEDDHVKLGTAILQTLMNGMDERRRAEQFMIRIGDYLAAAGGINGLSKPLNPERLPAPRHDGQPYRLPLESRRDSRFQVTIPKNPSTYVPDYSDPAREGLEQMMWVRFHEMSPAETVAAIIYLETERPWAFTYDLARHCWDEVRHSAFGKAALEAQGIDPTSNPNWIGFAEMALSQLDPIEAYTHLTVAIEQAAMKYPPGKRQEYEFCRDVARSPLMALYQDYDWADEVVHSHFGQEWVIKTIHKGDRQAAIAAGQATVERRAEFFEKFLKEGEELDGISKKARGGGSSIGY